MKILQVTNTLLSGGAEKLVVDMSILLYKQQIEVDILLLDGSRTPYFDSLEAYPNIKIISLGNFSNLYKPQNIFKIKRYLKKYDLIHVHLFPALYWVSLASSLSRKKHTIIATEHNTTNRRRKLLLFKFLDRLVYKKFTSIVSISNAVDINLKQHLGSKFQNVTKIYNGIQLKTFEKAEAYNKEELGYHSNDILLIQVASFTPQKDQKTIIEAMASLPDNYKLLLVGIGPLKEEHELIVKQLELTNQIEFLGVRSDVPSLLKTADLVILSSHYEGLSLSSIEAMASSTPFVATDAPGLTEVVQGAGVLFEDGNVQDLKNNILRLTNNQNLYMETADLCSKRAQQFDINIMVSNYIKLYNKTVLDS